MRLVGSPPPSFFLHDSRMIHIIQCLPDTAIREICLQQAQDFCASGGGVPDLVIWNPETKEARFVEVKSPSDKLSETQKVRVPSVCMYEEICLSLLFLQLWIHALREAGATVEVCHVETADDRNKRLQKGKQRKKARSLDSVESNDRKSITFTTTGPTSSSVVVEDEEVWADLDVVDWFDEIVPTTTTPPTRKRTHEGDEGLQNETKRRKGEMVFFSVAYKAR